MPTRIVSFVFICLVCASQAFAQDAVDKKYFDVNGFKLEYVEQGQGIPVIFLHGAFNDHRAYNPQREIVSKSYRFIAYDLRYHGRGEWPDDGHTYSPANHVSDLAAIISSLDSGPVHLVGGSYGAWIAVLLAVERPELVRSLTLREPAIYSLLVEAKATREIQDRKAAFAAVLAAIKAGDNQQATKLFLDWAMNHGPGEFERQSELARAMILENARTLPRTLSAPRPSPITCAKLGKLKIPTLIIGGADTRSYYAAIERIVNRCIDGSTLLIVANATHAVSSQQPKAFNEALLGFLSKH